MQEANIPHLCYFCQLPVLPHEVKLNTSFDSQESSTVSLTLLAITKEYLVM